MDTVRHSDSVCCLVCESSVSIDMQGDVGRDSSLDSRSVPDSGAPHVSLSLACGACSRTCSIAWNDQVKLGTGSVSVTGAFELTDTIADVYKFVAAVSKFVR